MADVAVRPAREDDADDVAAFTEDTWAGREEADYLPDVFAEWVRTDDADTRTLVVDVDGEVGGLCRATMLSEYEAWLQGMRVAPDHRGAGHAMRLVGALFDWARERGATVARNLVFSWNDAGLGQSMAAGFEPRTSVRIAHPEPAPVDRMPPVTEDPDAAWSFWARSDARDALGGLVLAPDHSWALIELTRDRLVDLADSGRVIAVTGTGTRAVACRTRTRERTDELVAEYAVGAWADADAASSLFGAIRRDAHDLGAAETRVLIPETPRHVAGAAAARASPGDYPAFVLEADLTGRE